jgi:hypothetical protein
MDADMTIYCNFANEQQRFAEAKRRLEHAMSHAKSAGIMIRHERRESSIELLTLAQERIAEAIAALK